MNKKIIISFSILFLLTFNIFSIGTTSSIIKNNNYLIEDAELPTWAVGNYWKYDMNFDFIARGGSITKLSINAIINNMEINVIDFTTYGGESVYLLSVDGDITGDVFLFGEFNFAELDAKLTGNAYIATSTLAIKNFTFDVFGQIDIPLVGWRDMTFVMSMNFNPRFDFFDFPSISLALSPLAFFISGVFSVASPC